MYLECKWGKDVQPLLKVHTFFHIRVEIQTLLSLELHSHKQFVFEMKIATISNASFLWTYLPDSKSVAVFKQTLSF